MIRKNVRLCCFIPCLLVVCIMLSACKGTSNTEKQQEKIWLNEQDSWLSNFEVLGEKVYVNCQLCIVNNTEKEQAVNIYGDFQDDVQGGLLKEQRIQGYASYDAQVSSFLISPGEAMITVTFIGTFAGNHVMHDRNIPSITITPVNGEE